MREIYEVLTALESSAAASLAERGMTGEQAAALRRTVVDMDSALDRGDLIAWAHADRAFHWLLVEFGGNARMTAMVAACLDQSHRVRMLTLKLRPKPLASNRDHAGLIAAIEARDPDRARAIHTRHRSEAGRMLVGLLEEYGLTQL
jgi:DNA-binding GntR family transcriptional regulator